MIKVEGLTKRYARHVAVRNISFEVGKGEIVGFLGKNGAGKTTTMRVLTCFLPPTAGKATVAGFDVIEQSIDVERTSATCRKRRLCIPRWRFPITFLSSPNSKTSLRPTSKNASTKCANAPPSADVKDTIIGKLSKGYRQRVGIAQAIIHNPPVLILDEPTSGLDPEQQQQARQLIASLSGDHTIILSTHILSEVEQSCSNVIIINNGEIVAVDSVANLHRRGRSSEIVSVEVAGAPAAAVRQRLEEVAGVARVIARDSRDGTAAFEVEGLENYFLRPDLARAVVQSGWNLIELKAVGESLEEIFLELTRSERTASAPALAAAGVPATVTDGEEAKA